MRGRDKTILLSRLQKARLSDCEGWHPYIETGKIADLVVLPNNLFDTPRYELHKTKPDAVIMDGIVIQGEL